jgi:hypothetical protein
MTNASVSDSPGMSGASPSLRPRCRCHFILRRNGSVRNIHLSRRFARIHDRRIQGPISLRRRRSIQRRRLRTLALNIPLRSILLHPLLLLVITPPRRPIRSVRLLRDRQGRSRHLRARTAVAAATAAAAQSPLPCSLLLVVHLRLPFHKTEGSRGSQPPLPN